MDHSDVPALSEELKQAAQAAHREFTNSTDAFMQAQFAADGFPDTLCHYTDFAGLKGILETKSLWATYSRTMNDASEQKYGENAVRNYLAPLGRGNSPSRLEIAMGLSQRRDFASCFCHSSRVLSMWIAYAARGGGYCLEFAGANGLLSSVFPPFPVRLPFKMTYGAAPPEHLGSVLKYASDFAERGEVEASVAASWANLLALRFKHPAFHHEDEWRIVIPDPAVSTLKFRSGQADVKPYIDLCPVMPDGTQRLPLRKVVFGPTLRQDDALIEAIGLMLKRYGHHGVVVEPCGIPYRV